ncbi:hypothetical protein ACFSHP_24555 [Novosphingobium panipatense]
MLDDLLVGIEGFGFLAHLIPLENRRNLGTHLALADDRFDHRFDLVTQTRLDGGLSVLDVAGPALTLSGPCEQSPGLVHDGDGFGDRSGTAEETR